MPVLFYALLLATALTPPAAYVACGGGSGRVWGLVVKSRRKNGSAYRGSTSVELGPGGAPVLVRLAAISSFLLGVMAVPGGLAALVGLLFLFSSSSGHGLAMEAMVELSAPTGLMVAARLFRAGASMLKRERHGPERARTAAKWAIVHNAVLLAAVWGVAGAGRVDNDSGGWLGTITVYAAVSIAQALLMRQAAKALDAYEDRAAELETSPAA